jgi:exopolysaccharide biosynthesis polyprenyl glycosylphosphotransferase
VLTQSRQIRIRLLQISDGLLFALSLVLAYVLRSTFPFLDLPPLFDFSEYLWLLPAIAIIGPVTLSKQGFYHHQRVISRWSNIFLVMQAVTFTTIAMVVLLFFVRAQYARSVILLACCFGGLFAYIRHEAFLHFAASSLARSQWRQRILWVGVPEENRKLREALSSDEREQVESISEFDPRSESIEQLIAILHDFSINAVVFNLAGIDTARLLPVLSTCEREGVTVIVRPGVFAHGPFGMSVDWFAGEPVIHYHAQPARPSHQLIKRVIDFVGASVLLVLLLPFMTIIGLAIKLTSSGPFVFKQPRAGLNGLPFTMYKFRSMKKDAEKEQASLATFNEMTGPVFKLTKDPRITPLGSFLRRYSLDELPQLWNVLRGEMSLVGPRPLPVSEVKNFSDDAHRRRLSVRPGLTCLWQVRGRNNISDFADWVRLDLAYIDQWSLWLDFKIMIATLPVVIFGRGAR